MLKLFRPKPAPTPNESIEKLRDTIDLLDKREQHLQKKVDELTAFAKQNASKNKRRALGALKKKKMYEAEMEKTYGAKMTLEQQLTTIEGAQMSAITMQSMVLAAETLKGIHGEMTVEKVDDTVADIQDQFDVANQISDAIASFSNEAEDAELEDELAQLMQEDLEEQLKVVPIVTAEPPVQTEPIRATRANPSTVRAPVALTNEDSELAELERAFAS